MAKGQNGTAVSLKNRKCRTASQQAQDSLKKLRNMSDAQRRSDELRDTQMLAKHLRLKFPLWYNGTDQQIKHQHDADCWLERTLERAFDTVLLQREADLQRQLRDERRRREEEDWAAYKHEYVRTSLEGPSSWSLKRWLKQRTATYERVRRFFDEVATQLPRLSSDVREEAAA